MLPFTGPQCCGFGSIQNKSRSTTFRGGKENCLAFQLAISRLQLVFTRVDCDLESLAYQHTLRETSKDAVTVQTWWTAAVDDEVNLQYFRVGPPVVEYRTYTTRGVR